MLQPIDVSSGKRPCRVCNEILPLDRFHLKKSGRTHSWCKECCKKKALKSARKNKHIRNMGARMRYHLNRDARRAWRKDYEEKNREKIRGYWLSYSKRRPKCFNVAKKINALIRKGKMIRQVCGCGEEKVLAFHNFDYSDPMKFTWTCRSCIGKAIVKRNYTKHVYGR